MNRFNVYGFHIFKFHFNLNSFIMVFTNHFSFIYYNSQANINTLIKTADYMMRSKSISRGTEKTASLVICFYLSVDDDFINIYPIQLIVYHQISITFYMKLKETQLSYVLS